MLKQDNVMYEIINEIVSGKRYEGERIRRQDYDLNLKQMTTVFRKLADNGVIELASNSSYAVQKGGTDNAQEFCLSEIAKRFDEIADIAESGKINDVMLIEFIRLCIKDRKKLREYADTRWTYTIERNEDGSIK